MPAKSWLRACKRAPWMLHLSGRILRPSAASLGVESWIASLEATRVSHSQSQDGSVALKTQGTSGPTLVGRLQGEATSSNNSDGLSGSSSKTLPTIYEWDSSRSTLTFGEWVTELRRACLRRRKLVLRTNASGSSSWRTPSDDLKRGGAANPEHRLAQGHTLNLQDQGAYWGTPRASDGEKGGPNMTFGAGGHPLPSQAVQQMWGTPTSRDWKDGAAPSLKAQTNGLLSRQAPRSMTGGDTSSASTQPVRRQLNPTFVEWLMGWPRGWTVCGSLGTEWFHWQQRMRSELSRLL